MLMAYLIFRFLNSHSRNHSHSLNHSRNRSHNRKQYCPF